MDENSGYPSEITSFQLKEACKSRIFYLNKKRKFQAEQLGLPLSKHNCWDHRLPPESYIIYEQNQQVEDHIIRENAGRQAIDEGSEPESAKDSNSFVGDSDSAISVYSDAKFETEVSKMEPPDRPTTTSFHHGGNCPGDTLDTGATRHAGKEELMFVEREGDQYDGVQVSRNLEEPTITEFGSPLEYSCSEFETDSIEPCAEKELEDILYSSGVNPDVYVLSSGRWDANKDVLSGTGKPTIDQEFEQYFSMLML